MPRYYTVLSSVLVVGLSYALWTSRRNGAEWRAELAQGTENFLAGSRPPAVPLQARNRTVRLDSLCDGRKPMLVYFHRRDCPSCARLDESWAADACYVDPVMQGEGRSGISAVIGAARSPAAGVTPDLQEGRRSRLQPAARWFVRRRRGR